MALFYVTSFFSFFPGWTRAEMSGFSCVFEGVLEKAGVSTWWFDGVFVVECGVIVDRRCMSYGA